MANNSKDGQPLLEGSSHPKWLRLTKIATSVKKTGIHME
jgi:hypothetical protein